MSHIDGHKRSPREVVRLVAQRWDGDDGEARQIEEAAMRRLAWRLRRGGKTCSSCQETKPVVDFGRDSTRGDGLRAVCRSCRARRGTTPADSSTSGKVTPL